MKKITRKSFIAAISLVFISLLLLNVLVWKSVNRFLLDDLRSELSKKMSLARASLELSQISDLSPEKLKEFSDEIRNLTGLRTTLIDKKGDVLADSEIPLSNLGRVENHLNREEVQESLKRGHGIALRQSATINRQLVYYCENIEKDGRIVGFLRFAMFSPQFNKKRNFMMGLIVRVNLILLFVFIIGAWIYNFWLNRNFKKIHRQLVSARDDGGGYRLDKQKYQEFDLIASEFNRLSGALAGQRDAAREESRQILDIFNSMSEGLAALDKRGQILFNNDPFGKILGVEKRTLLSQTYYEWLHFPPLIHDIEKFLKDKNPVENRSKYYAGKYIEYEIKPLQISAAGDSGFLLVIRDVTKIRQLEKIRSDFVTNVSHEFKTPLTTIRGYAETLSDGVCEDEKMRGKFLQKILKQTTRLENLVSDLLRLSRIERNEIEEIKSFDPMPVIAEIAGEFEVLARGKKLEMKSILRVGAGECQVKANENLIHNILANLLSNAVQYNRETGKIELNVFLKDHNLYIEVADTGIGIPLKIQGRIFERFYRAEKTREYFPEGSGLGLSILKNTVELIGGKFGLESREMDGSKFWVAIPVA